MKTIPGGRDAWLAWDVRPFPAQSFSNQPLFGQHWYAWSWHSVSLPALSHPPSAYGRAGAGPNSGLCKMPGWQKYLTIPTGRRNKNSYNRIK